MGDELPSVASLVEVLTQQGVHLPAGPVRVDGYGNTPEMSRALLRLIRQGHKRAGTGLLWWHEDRGEPWTAPGEIEIVVNHAHRPSIVTRICSVDIVPFDAVSAAYAAIEGEGDRSLAYWREAHWRYFAALCQDLGRTPSLDMPVVCSVFEVLALLPDPDEPDDADAPAAPAQDVPGSTPKDAPC